MSIGHRQTVETTNKDVLRATFDTAVDVSLISAESGKCHYIVQISMHNNDTTEANDEVVLLRDGSGGTVLYGDTAGGIYLPGRGGVFGLPMSVAVPHFSGSVNTALYMDLTNGRRICGAIWYFDQ